MDVVGAARAAVDTLQQNLQKAQIGGQEAPVSNQLEEIQKNKQPKTLTAAIKANQEEQKEKDKIASEEAKAELSRITNELNNQMSVLNTSIRFGYDDKVEQLYVNVIDSKTQKIIRKIPSEELLKLAAKMKELIGIIFDKTG